MREMWISKLFIAFVMLVVIGLFIVIALAELAMKEIIKENEELREQLGKEESGEDSDNDVFFNDFRKND